MSLSSLLAIRNEQETTLYLLKQDQLAKPKEDQLANPEREYQKAFEFFGIEVFFFFLAFGLFFLALESTQIFGDTPISYRSCLDQFLASRTRDGASLDAFFFFKLAGRAAWPSQLRKETEEKIEKKRRRSLDFQQK